MSDTSRSIIESMCYYASLKPVRMHMPGHKGRKAFSLRTNGANRTEPTPEWARSLLDELRAIDMTESPGLDNLHYPTGCIRETEKRAESLFGSARTHLLVNGATSGVHAALMAVRMTLGTGTVVLPRNVHRSMVPAMAMSGLEPVFVWPEYDPRLGGYLPLDVDRLRAVLESASELSSKACAGDGPPKAVFVINPTYCGFARDLTEMADLVHAHGAALIVDEAHGTHFFTGDGLPPSALQVGADLVIHGAHKTTVAYTQTAFVHVGRSTPQRFPALAAALEEALRAVQTTSPSYILMASLEQAIDMMERGDGAWIDCGVKTAAELTRRLSRIPGLSVVGYEAGVSIPPGMMHDPGRVLINLNGLRCTGPQAARYLASEHKVYPEMTGPKNLLLIWTGADGEETIDVVEKAFKELVKEFSPDASACAARYAAAADDEAGPMASALQLMHAAPKPAKAMSLREAFLSVAVPVPIYEAVGRISADTIVIYPPGSPLVTPGETIDAEIVKYIQTARKAGLNVLGRGIQGSNGSSGSNGGSGSNSSDGSSGSDGNSGGNRSSHKNNGNNKTMMAYCVAGS